MTWVPSGGDWDGGDWDGGDWDGGAGDDDPPLQASVNEARRQASSMHALQLARRASRVTTCSAITSSAISSMLQHEYSSPQPDGEVSHEPNVPPMCRRLPDEKGAQATEPEPHSETGVAIARYLTVTVALVASFS